MGELHRSVITWKQDGPGWLVNFLHLRSRIPLTRQRTYQSPQMIRGFVARSMTTLTEGPRKTMFQKDLEKGSGEIEVAITGVKLNRLMSS